VSGFVRINDKSEAEKDENDADYGVEGAGKNEWLEMNKEPEVKVGQKRIRQRKRNLNLKFKLLVVFAF
jgi:hypothetical protein